MYKDKVTYHFISTINFFKNFKSTCKYLDIVTVEHMIISINGLTIYLLLYTSIGKTVKRIKIATL